MVSSVSNSLGSAAYLKAQTSPQPGTNAAFKRQVADEQNDKADQVQKSRDSESAQTQRSTDSKDSLTRAPAKTEIANRNDEQTIQTEQARGSLLDIAV